MNGKKENKINYSTEDIKKYLEGELSPSEMHAIESAALNDEFLADAIEGVEVYKMRDLGDFNADTERLRNIIENKRKNKYGPLFWKAASVIAVVATVVALTFNQYKDVKRTEVLAAKIIESKKEDEVIIPSALPNTANKKITQDTTTFTESSSHKPSFPKKREMPSPTSVSFEKEKIETDSFPAVASSTRLKSAPAPLQALQGQAAGIVIEEEIDKSRKRFYGVVKDDKGNPVVGASVLIKGTTKGVVTDVSGSFEIKNEGEDSTLSVLVNSIGYNDQAKKIFSNNPLGNNIILTNSYSAGLDEVVITGYDGSGSEERRAAPENDIVSENANKAKPITGWKAFKKYLQENKRPDSLQENIKGKVIVSFLIDDKGIPYDYSIQKPLSPFYDQEAIRLIKEGPRWKLRNSKTAKLSINIDF